MAGFVVKAQVSKWIMVAADTKEEAENIVWGRMNSDKIDFSYDGLVNMTASPCHVSKKDEATLQEMVAS
jgi:hypothetical protein